MAVTYHSVSTTSWATEIADGNSLQINKPSGLSVGDLMVAHIGRVNSGSSTNTVSEPAGWASIASGDLADATSSVSSRAYYKVASSGDVAASTFDFTNSTGFPVRMVCGAIYRISGQYGNPTGVGASGSTGTPTFANTITPTAGNNLLLLLIVGEGNAESGSVASYAIATDNPTWTERYDVYGNGTAVFGATDGDGVFAGATAPRVVKTATGNSSATITDLTQKSACVIVEVSPNPNATASLTPLIVSSSLGGTASGTANVTVAPLIATSTLPEETVTTQAAKVTNQAKSTAATVTNLSKS